MKFGLFGPLLKWEIENMVCCADSLKRVMPGLFIGNMLKENCDLYKMSRVTRIATNPKNPEKEQESVWEEETKDKKEAGELWEKKGGQNRQALKSGGH